MALPLQLWWWRWANQSVGQSVSQPDSLSLLSLTCSQIALACQSQGMVSGWLVGCSDPASKRSNFLAINEDGNRITTCTSQSSQWPWESSWFTSPRAGYRWRAFSMGNQGYPNKGSDIPSNTIGAHDSWALFGWGTQDFLDQIFSCPYQRPSGWRTSASLDEGR
jgi:hypothetical protein